MNETYGLGGFDPDHPNGNVIERTENNGDGTATRSTFDENGKPVATEIVEYVPPPELNAATTTEDRIAELQAKAAAHDKLVEILKTKNVLDAKDVGDIAATADIAAEVKP